MTKLAQIIDEILQDKVMMQLYLSEAKEGRKAPRPKRSAPKKQKASEPPISKASSDAVALYKQERKKREDKIDANKDDIMKSAKAELDAAMKQNTASGKKTKKKIARDLYKDEPAEPMRKSRRRGDEDNFDDDRNSGPLKEEQIKELREAVMAIKNARLEKK